MHTDIHLILARSLLGRTAYDLLSSLAKNAVIATHCASIPSQRDYLLLLQPHSFLKLLNYRTLLTPA